MKKPWYGSLRSWLLALFFALPLIGVGLQRPLEGGERLAAGAVSEAIAAGPASRWGGDWPADGESIATFARDATGDSGAILSVSWTGEFIGIDPVSGAGGLIAPTGSAALSSLAQDSNGTLYATGRAPPGLRQLLTIDPVTGAASVVASLDLSARSLAFSSDDVSTRSRIRGRAWKTSSSG